MVRMDLAFFLCCCRACLSGNQPDEESFYDLLSVDKDASLDEIKRAYKRRSLDLHPDKLAQKGKVVTEEDQARFTRMKEAYEVLSDKHKRETYDAIGEKGMKWIEEPFSVDPSEMANNFANSSTIDRSKIFAIFLVIAISVLILPVLVCLQIDGTFGANAKWVAVATPLWIYNALKLFYHIRIIMMGPIEKPDHIPEEEWSDPLPMSKRYLIVFRFVLAFIFQLLAVLNLDGTIVLKWSFVFIPVFILQIMTLFQQIKLSNTEVVTIEELESIVGKPFGEFTEDEKDVMSKKYVVAPSKTSQEYKIRKSLQESAKTDVLKITYFLIFLALLMVQIDVGTNWNWWLVVTPFFIMSCCLCCTQCRKVSEMQEAAIKLDGASQTGTDPENGTDYGAMEEGKTPDAQPNEPLSEEQREEIKSEMYAARSTACNTCCTQILSMVLVCLCVRKIQGAGFSSLWIISPFLFFVGIILCVLGCAIFGVSPVDEEEMMHQYQSMDHNVFSPDPAPTVDPEQPSNLSPVETTNGVASTLNPNVVLKSEEPPEKKVTEQTTPLQPQIVDLLDDNAKIVGDAKNQTKEDTVGPTASEVDDLD